METVQTEIRTKKAAGRCRIYCIGDMHSDSLCFDEARFRAFVAFLAKDPEAIVLSVGDYVEGRVPGQLHFDPKALIPEARQNIGDYVSWALDRSERLLAPLRKASIPLFLWQGNHDHYMQWSGFTAELSRRLKATYMGDEGLIRCAVGRPRETGPSRRDQIVIYGTHGSGGAGLPGAKVNAMVRYMSWVDADVIVAGHVHDGMIRIQDKIGITKKGTPDVVHRPVVLWRAPSFLARAVKGVHTYAGRKSYPTADNRLLYVESYTRNAMSDSQKRERAPWRDWKQHEFVG